jgi:hypothetical protein
LSIMIIDVKLDSMHNYAKIWISLFNPFLDRISLFVVFLKIIFDIIKPPFHLCSWT